MSRRIVDFFSRPAARTYLLPRIPDEFAALVLHPDRDRFRLAGTQAGGVIADVTSGVAYYWVPARLGLLTPLLLGAAFFGYVFGVQAFGVADRLVDTELFPTRLRGTYAGVRMIGDAASQVLANFGLAAAIALLGSIERALAVFVPLLVLPALALFWWVTTESRGLSLDEAARERPADTRAAR